MFVFFAVGVGLYPFMYFVVDLSGGLMSTKAPDLLESKLWNVAFYQHIIFGGISLLAGFSQFSGRLRNSRVKLRRFLGKVYLAFVLLSGSAALYLAFFATGGPVSMLGFGLLSVAWLLSTGKAYSAILRKLTQRHQAWMIRSYALTFAAVTLRLWLPLFDIVAGMDFMTAYPIVSWLCWLPNLVVAEIVIRNLNLHNQ